MNFTYRIGVVHADCSLDRLGVVHADCSLDRSLVRSLVDALVLVDVLVILSLKKKPTYINFLAKSD